MPSPSSATIRSTAGWSPSAARAALEPHRAPAVPHGVLDQVGDDLLEPVGVGPQRAEVVGHVDDERVTLGSGGDASLDLGLQAGRSSSGWACTVSRPALIREASSSSVISRVTRSASASIVSSMRRFWSSVNRSQLRSRVEENPLTPVSGERSSWATVVSRAALSASARRRPSASRRPSTTARTGSPGPPAHVLRGDEQLAPGGQHEQPLAVAGAGDQALPRVGDLPPRLPLEVLQRQRLADVAAEHVDRGDAGDPLGRASS